jgi:hypothetical protein
MIGDHASKVVLPKAVVGLWLLGWWVMLWLGGTGPALGLGLGDRAGQGALSAAGRGASVGAGLGVGNEAFDIAAEELMKHVGGLPSDLTACEVLERLKNAGLIGGGLGGLGGGAAKALSEMDWRKLLSRFRNSDEAIEALTAAKSVANPVPSTFARVIPEGVPATTLGRPVAADVFVTAADDIVGMNAAQIAQRLTIPGSPSGFRVVQFPTPQSGIASPVFRPDPGFIGGGRTAGGAREFVIPNGPIPAGSTINSVR